MVRSVKPSGVMSHESKTICRKGIQNLTPHGQKTKTIWSGVHHWSGVFLDFSSGLESKTIGDQDPEPNEIQHSRQLSGVYNYILIRCPDSSALVRSQRYKMQLTWMTEYYRQTVRVHITSGMILGDTQQHSDPLILGADYSMSPWINVQNLFLKVYWVHHEIFRGFFYQNG